MFLRERRKAYKASSMTVQGAPWQKNVEPTVRKYAWLEINTFKNGELEGFHKTGKTIIKILHSFSYIN